MTTHIKSYLKRGIISENPIFVQAIALCPALAVSGTVFNGLGMGLATAFVLLLTNTLISLLRGIIPIKARIPCFVVIIAGAVTAVNMLVEAFIPVLHANLGIFLPLIAVNCIILARGESFAFKNGPIRSAFDALGMGLGFTIALVSLSAIRELFGFGTLFAETPFVVTMPEAFPHTLLLILPPGAFLTLGAMMAGLRHIGAKRKSKSNSKEAAS
ncbi:MAG: electron transport complex subunit E [Clostridiales bacterium]|jgi:electron transport complex protein RnfE|nr:electron transport complex subunit E [Clostridiales bacterium]